MEDIVKISNRDAKLLILIANMSKKDMILPEEARAMKSKFHLYINNVSQSFISPKLTFKCRIAI